MWFLSKKNTLSRRGGVPFLRKALPERRERRTIQTKHGRNAGSVFLLWGLFLGTIFYLFFFSFFVLIERVQISGMSTVPEETLQGFARDQLAGKYWNIFPKRAYTVVSPRVLEERFRREFPLLATISVERIFPNTLCITVTERKKIILWYAGDVPYLVDEEGSTQDGTRALSQENQASVITLIDTSGKSVGIGEKVFDPSYGAFVIEMNEMFGEQLGTKLEPRYTAVSRFAEELRAKTDEGWEVYFSTDVSVETSLKTLKLLFEKELPRERRANLAYIDLRVENRVYYAFRDGTNVEDTPVAPISTQKKNDTQDTSTKKKKQ